MIFERIVSRGLAQNSFFIGSGQVAAVIDPRRDCGIYLDLAEQHECVITHIFETHRNEDYVSGSAELSGRCGAEICHGSRMDFTYGRPAHDGDHFTIGTLEITVLETPGHTEESISLVVRDRDVSDQPYMVFCGDTLFSGDIARTDFFGPARKAEMAEKIFCSITEKLLPLGDGVIVCPAHGAGSICGGEIADHPFTTIGYERKTNPVLLLGKEGFVAKRITESPYLPPYFRTMEHYNRVGAPLLPRDPRLLPLTVMEVNEYRKTGCLVIDIRAPTSFGAGHIPESLSLWRDGISAFLGWFADYKKPIVLVDDFNQNLEEVYRHLIRLGYDNTAGFLAGGFPAWTRAAKEISTLPTCSVHYLKKHLESATPFLLDVRDIRNRRTAGFIRGSDHIYAGEVPQYLDRIPRDEPVFVYCDAGYKGSLAASFLAAQNYRNVTNVLGGMTAWKQAGFRIEKG
ncbi:MBL fold metallo-hydrolase [uncultured Methanoregula sp.]|uniref:MBL fold metallo-hydrolase n=1 Tax=uncultured Methanoregula sp. TaxID=1005933 RepID=UPI002AAB5453|nr:MBL fold metallo-hydrolase [uncultured Methanoregula sp.]